MSDEDNGTFVRIGNREIYNKLEAMDDTIKDLAFQVSELTKTRADNTKRIKTLELKFYAILAGLISGWGATAAIVMTRKPG
jgi:hypothetical protein